MRIVIVGAGMGGLANARLNDRASTPGVRQ